MDEILKCENQMKATEQYFSVVLFTMLYKAVPNLSLLSKMHSVDECFDQP